jgi:hypothetical protein
MESKSKTDSKEGLHPSTGLPLMNRVWREGDSRQEQGHFYDANRCNLGYQEFHCWSHMDMINEILRLRDTEGRVRELYECYKEKDEQRDRSLPEILRKMEQRLTVIEKRIG